MDSLQLIGVVLIGVAAIEMAVGQFMTRHDPRLERWHPFMVGSAMLSAAAGLLMILMA